MTATASTDIDTLIDDVIKLKAQAKLLDAQLSSAMDQLTTALQAGDIDPSFSHDDWAFTYNAGRITTTYSAEAKQAIKQLQDADIQMGRATQKRGVGFWTVKAPVI
jgi:hypothetical protein